MQVNHITQARYQGQNNDTLNHVQAKNGYQSNEWVTYLQAKSIGLLVKSGEKGTKIFKLIQDDTDKSKYAIRTYVVFNIDQTIKINVYAI